MIIGGGGYGLVALKDDKATKYFYDIESCEKIKEEAAIQKRVRQIFIDNKVNIRVPEIYNLYNFNQKINDKTMLYGIEMEYVPILKAIDGINSQIHLAFGYTQDDIDSEWIVKDSNIPRGFYASQEMIELILEERKSKLSIDDITTTMGKGIALLLTNNIIPNDVEWILDNDLNIWMIDFGLCREGKISLEKYLHKTGVEGLANDIYVPKKGMKGYERFIESYMN